MRGRVLRRELGATPFLHRARDAKRKAAARVDLGWTHTGSGAAPPLPAAMNHRVHRRPWSLDATSRGTHAATRHHAAPGPHPRRVEWHAGLHHRCRRRRSGGPRAARARTLPSAAERSARGTIGRQWPRALSRSESRAQTCCSRTDDGGLPSLAHCCAPVRPCSRSQLHRSRWRRLVCRSTIKLLSIDLASIINTTSLPSMVFAQVVANTTPHMWCRRRPRPSSSGVCFTTGS